MRMEALSWSSEPEADPFRVELKPVPPNNVMHSLLAAYARWKHRRVVVPRLGDAAAWGARFSDASCERIRNSFATNNDLQVGLSVNIRRMFQFEDFLDFHRTYLENHQARMLWGRSYGSTGEIRCCVKWNDRRALRVAIHSQWLGLAGLQNRSAQVLRRWLTWDTFAR